MSRGRLRGKNGIDSGYAVIVKKKMGLSPES